MNNTTLLKLQCTQLGLLIALSQGTKRWGERTVIMRKGKLVSVGGEIMPKDPPAYRVLTPEQWMRFIQGDIKNFGDINRKQTATETQFSLPNLGIKDTFQDFKTTLFDQSVKDTGVSDALLSEVGISLEQAEERYQADKNRFTLSKNTYKYNFTRRLREAEEIYEQLQKEKNPQKIEELRLSLMWHKGLLQADVKYGKILDDFAFKGNDDAASSLMNKLKEGKSKDTNIIARHEKIDVVTVMQNPETKEDFVALVKTNLNNDLGTMTSVLVAKNKAESILSMSETKPEISLGFVEPRGFQLASTDYQEIDVPKSTDFSFKMVEAQPDSYINIGKHSGEALTATVYHECGHAIERKAGLVSVSKNYIMSRSTGELISMQTINPGYDKNELAFKSDFVDPYIAKDYGLSAAASGVSSEGVKNAENAGTELVSMSVQNLTNPGLLKSAANEDREHILYGLWALDYKP